MRAYLLLFLLVCMLLLMLPLPAFGLLASDKPAQTTAAATTIAATAVTTTAPTSSENVQATAAQAVFRVCDAEGKLHTLPERQFLIGTLAAEMYPTYHIEAMKAQAVAAYTYYSYERTQARADGDDPTKADFDDVPSTFPAVYSEAGLRERFGDRYDEYYTKLCEAVDAVLGKQLLYQGKPIMAVYHAMSFETTEDAKVVWGKDLPYLRSVPATGDRLAPSYRSVVTFSDKDFAAKLDSTVKLSGDASDWIEGEPTRSKAGTVTAITIGGKEMTGRELRQLLELRSACFTVTHGENGFTFTVEGYGHGVGMSQYGADYLARQGADYQTILKYYYTGVTIA